MVNDLHVCMCAICWFRPLCSHMFSNIHVLHVLLKLQISAWMGESLQRHPAVLEAL